MKNKLRKIITASMIGLASFIPFKQAYAKADGKASCWGRVSGYIDSRANYNVVFTGGASGLPFGMNLFGFADAETEKHHSSWLKKPYTEVSLAKKTENGLGAAIEHNRDFNFDKGVTRVGLVYEPSLLKAGVTGLKFYPLSTNNNGVQAVLYGSKRFNKGDIVVDGFFDYNFKPRKIVTEIQVGKRLNEGVYGVVEWRYNGFKDKGERMGAGVGLEWRF